MKLNEWPFVRVDIFRTVKLRIGKAITRRVGRALRFQLELYGFGHAVLDKWQNVDCVGVIYGVRRAGGNDKDAILRANVVWLMV